MSLRQKNYVNKKLKVVEAIQDSTGAPGTAGQVLTSTVTGTEWANAAGATFTFTQGEDEIPITNSEFLANSYANSSMKHF